ncbi:Ubiquinone biosynthesis protein coq9, mitochondrial [Arachnomyces sp. PD_36]|nr:Ubiquinone biosynthesis protein coq9, mitochondrial [Arachnomyces sp. PD_36]
MATVSTVSSTLSRTALASSLTATNARHASTFHTASSRRGPRQRCQRQCSNSPTARRAYHSRNHPPFPPHYTYPESPSANSILTAALEHVPRHGFTNEALILGARDAGYLDVSVQLFPRGAFEIILFYLASRRELLRERVEKGEIFGGENGAESLSVEEKVKRLAMERLRMNEGVINQWQDALALMSLPTHVPASLSELHSLSSDILTLASDPSVDASWYTKRLSLSAVYASAEVVMTQDTSPNFTATEAFVQRRLEDSKGIGETAADVKGFLGYMATSAAGLGRSWGLKI